MPTTKDLLRVMPPYMDQWVMVKRDQEVKDIIREILAVNKEFGWQYDLIAPFFWTGNLQTTCEKIYKFLLSNVAYCEESEDVQTSAIPVGILNRGFGDCKHFALFAGGVLGAISRTQGVVINWCFCFASYKLTEQVPYHVFVVCETSDGPVWIDPTPGAEGTVPVWVICKRADGSSSDEMVTRQTGKIAGCGCEAGAAVGSVEGLNESGELLAVGLLIAVAALLLL